MYILHIQGARVVWLSCNKLSAGFLSLACVSAKRGGKGSIDCFVWLICSAHYISRHRQICVIANIAAPVVFVMPQSLRNESSCSLTHTRGMGGMGGGHWQCHFVCRQMQMQARARATDSRYLFRGSYSNNYKQLCANCPPISLSFTLLVEFSGLPRQLRGQHVRLLQGKTTAVTWSPMEQVSLWNKPQLRRYNQPCAI